MACRSSPRRSISRCKSSMPPSSVNSLVMSALRPSKSISRFTSSAARLSLAKLLPMVRAISGILAGPTMIKARTKINNNSHVPMPNMTARDS